MTDLSAVELEIPPDALEAPAVVRRRRHGWPVRSWLWAVLPPIALGVLVLALWEWFVTARDIQPYLLPKPSAIWDEIVANWDGIVDAAKATGANALVGLICGTALGIIMAFIASRFRTFREMTTPLAAAINAVPIIALAPMFYNMFSTTSAYPRRLVVTIVVFFPIFVNVLKGLTQVNPIHTELMRSYAASDWTILRRVRLPNALPYLFTGLKVASSLCVIAAVVSEYFGGLQDGLGSKITAAAGSTSYDKAWAFVAAACGLGLLFYLAALLAERLARPWLGTRPEA
jgi:NitT/TauT family transport system permease protein